jgi:1,2-diacylglycerol 3-beta-galactosyltransferase
MTAPRKIVILTADAGFGHRAAANAIAAALAENYGSACETTIVNPLADPHTPALLRRSQSDYDRLVEKSPEIYSFGYRKSDSALPVDIAEQGLIVMLYAALRDVMRIHQPDAIVTTYPLYQAPAAAVFALTRRYVPLLTVVTDLATVHALWFNDEVDLCLVPTPFVAQKALQQGLPRDRVIVTGLPVNPRLGQPVDREALRAQLGWQPDRVTALLTGSKRVHRLGPVAQALNHSGLPLQLAAVAGGNERLLAEWQACEWHLPAHVYGYVQDMVPLMLAADFVVCKAGGLIVSEALAAGKPLLLIEAIPGQETGNADFVVQGGAGEMAPEALDALSCVYHWLDRGGALMAERANKAQQLGSPHAAQKVAGLAWEMARRGPQPREHRLLSQVSHLRELLAIQ